jgi:O-antigen ligase
VLVILAIVTVFVFFGVAVLAQERFADIGTMLDKNTSLLQPPERFSQEETRMFSGRAYLWSKYIDAYLDGSIINILVGFGPEGWVGRFSLYAHNTFVSYLYELGLFGIAAFLWILISNFLTALRANSDDMPILISCHIGFFVLNLATMPFWTLEGAILYALLLGQTWHLESTKVSGEEILHRRIRLRASGSLQSP